MKKHLKSLGWTVLGITPLFLYMDLVMEVNLLGFGFLKIIGIGICLGFFSAIEQKFNKKV